MKRSQLDISELESSHTAPCKVRRLYRRITLQNLPDDVLITVLEYVTGEKFDRGKQYRLSYKSINGLTSPHIFPAIPGVRPSAMLNSCRTLKNLGHQFFKVVTVDGIPLLQQSSERPHPKNPAFPIYLSYCVQNFHSTIQTLQLPFIASPHQFSNILRNKKYTFPCLRDLRFTQPSPECRLTDMIAFSTRLSTLDVSSPSEGLLWQLCVGFPAVESLTLRDIRYAQLGTLCACLEVRSSSYTTLKYLSVNLESPKKAGLTSIESKLMQTKCLDQFMIRIKAKAKTVLKDLEYFHLCASGHQEALMELTRNDAKVGPESDFAPDTVLDFGISYAKLTGIYRDCLNLGQKVLNIVYAASFWLTAEHWSREIPTKLKYLTTIEISSYDDVIEFNRNPRMFSILETISRSNLPHLRTLSLPFCINPPGASPAASIRCVLCLISAILKRAPSISQLEISSEVLESGKRLDPHFSVFTESLINLKAIHFQRPDKLRKRAFRQENTFERNSILVARLPDFLKGIQHCRRLEEIEIEVTQKGRGGKIPNNELSKLVMSSNLLKAMKMEMHDTDFSSIWRLIRDW